MNCALVNISPSGISQFNGTDAVVSVPRERIVRIVLGHDSHARHPFLQFMMGFIMIATGIILGIGAFLLDLGGVYLVKLQSLTFGVPVAPLVIALLIWAGGWLLAVILRGRYHLLVHTPNGMRKIYFAENADIHDIRHFLGRAQTELGYEIDVSLMAQMHLGDRSDCRREP
jgi:hypothetical protein